MRKVFQSVGKAVGDVPVLWGEGVGEIMATVA